MRLPQFLYNWQKKLHKMFEKSSENSLTSSGSIQEIAGRLAEEQQRLRQLEATSSPKERTLFVLGSKCVGKTMAINKFFDRDEQTMRPTLALEYSYGRRIGSGRSAQVLNVWELGSLDNAEQLLEVPMRTHGLQQLSAFIMVDLSQPQRVWTDLECAYRGLRDTAQRMMQSATPEQREYLERRALERMKHVKQDVSTLELLPFPLVIVGGKYDIFMDFEPALKKHICRCLRSMAHLVGGAVLFYSHKLPKLAKVLRDTISHLGFGSPTNPFRAHITDYNEALSIWFGTDSWSQIGIGESSLLSVERIGATLSVEVPQLQLEKQKQQLPQNPAKDVGFSESLIDEMRAQKDDELAGIMRDVLLRGKFETVQG
ncbi:LOW QUALITY PROTEIN: cytoplasmic dynein 2 light intermediate chain 1 [Drosophila sulfurigaster albostrigata]|uniref:LOW QUALITY PROTEIN: cytoplasmic dynein 2 light intermediate chain 1 n=1 Tax=Drosophila sulfurigaster albostrigata TaxID=89887 RepID=UPI002D21BD59|nr:LOW QUALITY PROTEIN: cytoplasmic dynein 2 light intermediate chain 1 [Drosophila sulfurigaster albostrigata]